MPIPGLPEWTFLNGLALSPDGSELAVMFQPDVDGSYPTRPITLRIYSVRSGKAVRTWTGPANASQGAFGWDYGRDSDSSITWLADGHTLAFGYGVTDAKNDGQDIFFDVTLRTLDLNRPGHDLLADSKAVLSLNEPQYQFCGTLQLTADGKTAVCGRYSSTAAGNCSLPGPRFLEYTIATGKPRTVYQLKGSSYGEGFANALWASPSGTTLIGSATAHCGDSYSAAGIIANGTLTPLKFPAGIPFAGEAAY